MGIFDTYKPAHKHICPVCGGELEEWQGKDGPCGLFVWSEGLASPFGQNTGENNLSEEERGTWRLPGKFEIYSYDCGCPYPVVANCKCENDVWVTTELVTASNAKQRKEERKEDFKKRLKWLEGRAT